MNYWARGSISPDDPLASRKRFLYAMDLSVMNLAEGRRGPTDRYILSMMQSDDNVYRINTENSGRVEVLCFGIESIDTELDGYYDSLQVLPQWVQERITLLSMLSSKPPTEEVKGIGRRISLTTYWVYKPSK